MDPTCRHAAFRPGMLAFGASPAETVGTVPERLSNRAGVVLQLVRPRRSHDGQPFCQDAESEPRRRPPPETTGYGTGRTGKPDRRRQERAWKASIEEERRGRPRGRATG